MSNWVDKDEADIKPGDILKLRGFGDNPDPGIYYLVMSMKDEYFSTIRYTVGYALGTKCSQETFSFPVNIDNYLQVQAEEKRTIKLQIVGDLGKAVSLAIERAEMLNALVREVVVTL